eukprot:TRINITY_DN15174_c1_g5_i1.p1 TRINITY_DN15174_c1_g5~~TRINITY_DN15174_c1_g5_i1.p1  ORF type:complete len:621 (+),score=82.46 TRINITY_DN15174_c1_g5_i1:295-2157(+)
MGDVAESSLISRLGLICSSMCGDVSERRRMAADISRVQKHCEKLKASVCEDDDMPIEHIRAVERHLAVLERWLISKRIHTVRSNVVPAWQAEALMQEVGVSDGLEREEALSEFKQHFGPVPEEETFVTSLSCSALSRSFRYPGKLYISCFRLCFDSSLLGMSVNFVLPWDNIRSLLYIPTTNTTFPVKISLKKAMEFDGKDLDDIDIRIFDYNTLKVLHKSAMYFLGTGLFGLWEDGSREADAVTPVTSGPRPAQSEMKGNLSASKRRVSTGFVDEASATRALQQTYAIWEIERRPTVFSSWGAPSLPHDGVRKMKWCAMDPAGKFVRHPLVPEDADAAKFAACKSPPLDEVDLLGLSRACEWTRAQTQPDESDADGWQYATGFTRNMGWTGACSKLSIVRRRRWIPTFSTVETAPAARMERLASTYITQKGIGFAGGAPRTVYDADLGELSLEALGRELGGDGSWEADPNGGLMATYYSKVGARNMDIGAWAEGGASGNVQGKARSIEYIKPLPPKPLCPRESRIQQTVHVVVSEEKVILEQSVMTLDVPAGTAWILWVRDTFTSCDGRVRMQRDCACEWLQSCWIKSMIESQTPKATAEETPPMIESVMEWAKKSGAQ